MKKTFYGYDEYLNLVRDRGGAKWLVDKAGISLQQAYNILRGGSRPSEATLNALGATWVIAEVKK